jgi:outer membrane murein-binding lipoprotein Lpp
MILEAVCSSLEKRRIISLLSVIVLPTILVAGCSSKTKIDITYCKEVGAKLELFYRYLNQHQEDVQAIIANKFILLNKSWLQTSRENLDKWYRVCRDIEALESGPRTKDAHKILVEAMDQCEDGIIDFQMFYTTLDDAYVAKSTSHMGAMDVNLRKCCKMIDVAIPE